MNANSPSALARAIFAGKDRGRKAAAALPIEEKLRRLVAMQQRANEIRQSTGRRPIHVWQLN